MSVSIEILILNMASSTLNAFGNFTSRLSALISKGNPSLQTRK